MIELANEDVTLAAGVGALRQINNIRKGREPRYGAGKRNAWQLAIEGSIGEYVLSKHLGIFWSGAFDFGARDVGKWQVRTTVKNGRLIVHPDDNDDDRFVLIWDLGMWNYKVVGWMYGKDAKQDKWWDDPTGGNRAAFFVPAQELNTVTLEEWEKT